MKYIIALIAATLVLGGAWYLFGSAADAPETMDEAMHEENMTEDSGSDDAGADIVVDENAVVIDISGHNFEYDQSEIRVKEGDTVVINFTSTDGFHDWVVDEFNAKTARVSTGNTTSVTFVADKAGTYEYYCSVGTHRQQGMVGSLIVE